VTRSVRGRLLVGLVVLVAVGLGAVGAVTWTSLRSFLVGRVDGQIVGTERPVAAQLDESLDLAQIEADPSVIRGIVPTGVFVQIRAVSSRRVVLTVSPVDANGNPIDPSLPTPVPRDRIVTVGVLSGSGEYRLEAFRTAFSTETLVGMPLAPVTAALHRVVLAEVVASLVTLLLVGVLALLVIRVGLQPLDDMAGTATAIAGGDLGRRVAADSRTEVGRLGLALNAMLGQIEAAFANRQASEERLRRFVSDASHELRTPLTSIRGYAELFRSGAASRPDDLATAMGRIESEAERMGGMLDDLLLLARLDQGRPLAVGAVDLAAVAVDAAADAAVVGTHPVSVEAPSPVWTTGDDARLRQVATNLVGNARQHTPEGTPITVRAFGEGGMAVLEVSDAGPGLSAEEAERVWDRFWRASRTPAGGSGLGLSIVAAIVRAHGGRVAVRGTPGGGATFRIELPAAPGPAG